MDRKQVISTYLESVGYDPKSQILEVSFQNGNILQYYDISNILYEELMKAPSKGGYFDLNIGRAGFSYKKVN